MRNSNHERIGFDLITFDGSRGPLARDSSLVKSTSARNKVGKYSVCVEEFEAIAIPILVQQDTELFVIDEIGKMEMKSVKFENSMKSLIESVKAKRIKMVATIPQKATINLVEQMKAIPGAKLFTVTKSNRNDIYEEIFEHVGNMIK
jgi:nucleoside-triphosphatase